SESITTMSFSSLLLKARGLRNIKTNTICSMERRQQNSADMQTEFMFLKILWRVTNTSDTIRSLINRAALQEAQAMAQHFRIIMEITGMFRPYLFRLKT